MKSLSVALFSKVCCWQMMAFLPSVRKMIYPENTKIKPIIASDHLTLCYYPKEKKTKTDLKRNTLHKSTYESISNQESPPDTDRT